MFRVFSGKRKRLTTENTEKEEIIETGTHLSHQADQNVYLTTENTEKSEQIKKIESTSANFVNRFFVFFIDDAAFDL